MPDIQLALFDLAPYEAPRPLPFDTRTLRAGYGERGAAVVYLARMSLSPYTVLVPEGWGAASSLERLIATMVANGLVEKLDPDGHGPYTRLAYYTGVARRENTSWLEEMTIQAKREHDGEPAYIEARAWAHLQGAQVAHERWVTTRHEQNGEGALEWLDVPYTERIRYELVATAIAVDYRAFLAEQAAMWGDRRAVG